MVEGRLFDARSSAARPATLAATGDGRWVLVTEAGERLLAPSAVTVSARLGAVPRRLRCPDGAEFETTDNDGVDALLRDASLASGGVVHWLERRWGVAVGALLAVVLISVGVVRFGLPAAAGWAAQRMPASVDLVIGRQSLQILDRALLRPSQLPPQRQAELTAGFNTVTAGLDDGHRYRLEFRDTGLGANAFALPSGIVVITDDLVKLARHDEELLAVLAHEVGHVRGRHALRHLIQGAGVSALALVLLGDVSAVSALASAAPALLQARHSRELEREADGFARQWLAQAGIAATRFDDILCRMSSGRDGRPRRGLPEFLSTHPDVADRVRCAGD